MAGRQKEMDSPDRTVRAKKTIGKIRILQVDTARGTVVTHAAAVPNEFEI